MKRIVLISSLVVLLFSTAFIPAPGKSAAAQEAPASLNSDFAFIRAHRQGSGFTIAWGMLSNAGLERFDIEKTNQDPTDMYSTWEDVASIPGNDFRSFKHRDLNVLPGTTYYRITAFYRNGNSSVSEIVSVRIVQH